MKDWLIHHRCQFTDCLDMKNIDTKIIIEKMNPDSYQGVRA